MLFVILLIRTNGYRFWREGLVLEDREGAIAGPRAVFGLKPSMFGESQAR